MGTNYLSVCVVLSGLCAGTGSFCWGVVLFESLALRLLAIGAQVLGLGALDGVATNLMGVVSAYLMGVVALGGIRPAAAGIRLPLLGFSKKSVTNPT